MIGWHHRLNGHAFEQTLGVGDGQGSLVCCSPWGCKESDTTERLNTNSHCANTSLPEVMTAQKGWEDTEEDGFEIRNPYLPEPRDALEITHPPQRVPLKPRLDIFWS